MTPFTIIIHKTMQSSRNQCFAHKVQSQCCVACQCYKCSQWSITSAWCGTVCRWVTADAVIASSTAPCLVASSWEVHTGVISSATISWQTIALLPRTCGELPTAANRSGTFSWTKGFHYENNYQSVKLQTTASRWKLLQWQCVIHLWHLCQNSCLPCQ